MLVVAAALLALTSASPAPAAVPAPPPSRARVALLPLEVEGLAVNEVRRIDGVVRGRAVARAELEVLPEETTDALVDSSQTLGLVCHLPDTACAAQIGKIADVDIVIAGSAHRIAEGVSVGLALVDVKSGAAQKRVLGLVPTDPDAQVAAMQTLLHGLFGEAPLGAL